MMHGATGWFFNPTCFTAGTQVVVGMEYEDHEGKTPPFSTHPWRGHACTMRLYWTR